LWLRLNGGEGDGELRDGKERRNPHLYRLRKKILMKERDSVILGNAKIT